MRALILLGVLLAAGGCQKKVEVPTSKELMANPKLLAEWEAKCNMGEYSHLPASEKTNMCFTTQAAGQSLAARKSGKADSDFFNAISRRKETKP